MAVEILHNDQFEHDFQGISFTCYMTSDPSGCYVAWKSILDKLSQKKLFGFLEEVRVNEDILMDDVNSSLEILDIDYVVNDEGKKVHVVHLASLLSFCSIVKTVSNASRSGLSQEILDYVAEIVCPLAGCASDLLTIQSVKWRLTQ